MAYLHFSRSVFLFCSGRSSRPARAAASPRRVPTRLAARGGRLGLQGGGEGAAPRLGRLGARQQPPRLGAAAAAAEVPPRHHRAASEGGRPPQAEERGGKGREERGEGGENALLAVLVGAWEPRNCPNLLGVVGNGWEVHSYTPC